MYHFLGYVVRNIQGDVVHFAGTRDLALQFCAGNNLNADGITQAFEFVKHKVIVDEQVVTTIPTPDNQSSSTTDIPKE